MPRGYPDYNTPIDSIGAVSFDSSELAARLGSLSTIQRTGNVLWYDDLEHGLGSYKQQFSGSASIVHSALYAHRGASSVRLVPHTSTDVVTMIFRSLPMINTRRIGIEANVMIDCSGGSLSGKAVFGVHLLLASGYRYFGILINAANDKLYAGGSYNLDSGYTEIYQDTGLIGSMYAMANYHNIKFTIDVSTGKFDKLWYDARKFTIDTLDGYDPAILLMSGMGISLGVIGNAVQNPVHYDSIIVTVDEP